MEVLIPASLTYPSRTGGNAHTVKFTVARRAGIAGPAGSRYATCDCTAGRNFLRCWAVKDAAARFAVYAIGR